MRALHPIVGFLDLEISAVFLVTSTPKREVLTLNNINNEKSYQLYNSVVLFEYNHF